MEYKITTPLKEEDIVKLNAGDTVKITGVIYTARDAAHKRMAEALSAGQPLPIDMKNNIIYYMGPSPAREGRPIGSPRLIKEGLKGMVGKGARSKEVKDAIVSEKAVYFAAVGGAAALIAKSIKKAEIITYEDLGAEALRRLEVVDFPAIVINDIYGGDLYQEGQKQWNELDK